MIFFAKSCSNGHSEWANFSAKIVIFIAKSWARVKLKILQMMLILTGIIARPSAIFRNFIFWNSFSPFGNYQYSSKKVKNVKKICAIWSKLAHRAEQRFDAVGILWYIKTYHGWCFYSSRFCLTSSLLLLLRKKKKKDTPKFLLQFFLLSLLIFLTLAKLIWLS